MCTRSLQLALLIILTWKLTACSGCANQPEGDAGPEKDGGSSVAGDDAGGLDDAGRLDDAGAGSFADAGTGGNDAGTPLDGGPGAPTDAGSSVVDAGPAAVWHPAPGTSWQWQLTGTVDTSFDVAMYDIDLFDVPADTIATLKGAGRVVICYFSAGSYESWRDDAADLPSAALGNPLDGWPGERWLDVRNAGVRSVMRARLDLAVQKGCDGVEPDNVDGYLNNPGFDFGASDQLDYNRFLASEAHARGLSVGLKNDLDQVPALVSDFDWALNEECFAYDECDLLQPFIDAGKAVFNVEYGPDSLAATVCPSANALDFDTLIKNLDLDARRVSCR